MAMRSRGSLGKRKFGPESAIARGTSGQQIAAAAETAEPARNRLLGIRDKAPKVYQIAFAACCEND